MVRRDHEARRVTRVITCPIGQAREHARPADRGDPRPGSRVQPPMRRRIVLGLLAGALACGAPPPPPRRRRPRPARASGPPPPPNPPGTTIPADLLHARAAALRERLAGRGFTVVVEPPFVVAGDEAPAEVERRAVTIIRRAVLRLKAQYFPADPWEVVEVYLLRDEASYRHHARALFDERPDTPFGFYTPTHEAVLMNIAAGEGTLVHELVHPFVAANLPACPTWFNEGLASLYEHCEDVRGELVGRINWRLPPLQAAIRAGDTPPLAELLTTTYDQFHSVWRVGLHYAQSRYLCYYLQERGLLRNYYTQLRTTAAGDPTGRMLLLQTVGALDLERFSADWQAYVLALPPPAAQ